MSSRYVPVDIKLEARESINSKIMQQYRDPRLTFAPDMGVLRVDVVGARGLKAADRSGKSDVGLNQSQSCAS